MILQFGEYVPIVHAPVFMAPGSFVIGQAEIGTEASVWFNAVIRADGERIYIGQATNIQDLAVVHADPGAPAILGDRVTVGHGALVHGATVQSEVLIGMGAIVMNKAIVETHAIVGAGALIPEGMVVPSGTLALGRPARIVRAVTAEEIAAIQRMAATYVERWVREGWHFQ